MDKDAFKQYVNELLTVTVETDTSSVNKNIAIAGIVAVFCVTLFLIAK